MRDSLDVATRRQLLVSASIPLGAGIAGCFGSADDGDGGSPTDTPTEPSDSPSETENETGPTANSSTETETESETPSVDRPPVEQRTVQRDKAAITNVLRTVTGEITWPSFDVVDPVNAALLGDWSDGEYAFRFTDQQRFRDVGPDYDVQGTYTAYETTLDLAYDNGNEYSIRYQISTENGEETLDFWKESGEHVASYSRAAEGTDERGVVEVASNLRMVKDEDPSREGGELETGGSGTGFVVSSDGYVVTNAHVVGTHRDPKRSLYSELAMINRRALREEFANDPNIDDSQLREVENVLLDSFMSYYAEHSRVDAVSTDLDVLYGRVTPDDDLSVSSWPATVETAGTVVEQVSGEPSWGRDVAILKVDQEPLPTVPLGSSTDLVTGEKLFVVGYPDIGIGDYFEDRNTTLEPTLTSGVVSARRTLNSGVETIQTDAGINSGNSGGPIYNGDGEVVGIATFGPADLELQEIQFGLPIEIAKGFMGELGVENEPGELDVAFREGLDAYWRGDCDEVETRMESVLDMQPEHPYAREFVDDC